MFLERRRKQNKAFCRFNTRNTSFLGSYLICLWYSWCVFLQEIPASLKNYLLCTLLINVSCCIKLLIIAQIDEDFAIEFKRILKLRKSRKVGIDSDAEGSKVDEDPKFMPETRKYYCKMEENEFNVKTEESTVWHLKGNHCTPFCRWAESVTKLRRYLVNWLTVCW